MKQVHILQLWYKLPFHPMQMLMGFFKHANNVFHWKPINASLIKIMCNIIVILTSSANTTKKECSLCIQIMKISKNIFLTPIIFVLRRYLNFRKLLRNYCLTYMFNTNPFMPSIIKVWKAITITSCKLRYKLTFISAVSFILAFSTLRWRSSISCWSFVHAIT